MTSPTFTVYQKGSPQDVLLRPELEVDLFKVQEGTDDHEWCEESPEIYVPIATELTPERLENLETELKKADLEVRDF